MRRALLIAAARTATDEPSPASLAASYLQAATSTTDATSYTFADQGAGDAAADRSIVAVIVTRAVGTTPRTVTGVTIGGVAATIDVQKTHINANQTAVAIARAVVPTGTTATVVITLSGTVARLGCALYRVTGAAMAVTSTGDAGGSAGGAISTAAMTTAAGGVLIAGYGHGVAVDGIAWTGVTEDFDQLVGGGESLVLSGGSTATTGTDVTVTATDAASAYESALAAIAYQPEGM